MDGDVDALPPVAALFLVVFDKKVGYKIAWQRSVDGVELDGVVEYKSLPSGLHHVQTDLVYFTHGDYAGVSAFVSKAADESERNAHFAAVGVLVPLSYGRLGRAWMHAEGLRMLAGSEVDDEQPEDQLKRYWQQHRLDQATDEVRREALAEPSSPMGTRSSTSRNRQQQRRSRALSDAAGFSLRANVLSEDHPAMSMPEFLDVFGPLAFPIYRAALLRKRILLVGSAPIQRSCNYVYDLSIFSNVPPSLSDVLPTPNALLRIRPLFNVGVHDIPELSKKTSSGPSADQSTSVSQEGWLACTTDDIIATKRELFDLMVELPNAKREDAKSKEWPRVRSSDGTIIKATQRDLRRFHMLRRELRRIQKLKDRDSAYSDDEDESEAHTEDDTAPLVPSVSPSADDDYLSGSLEGESNLVEPQSWTSIAYSSFLWWASAGEKDALLAEELCQDSSLLEDLSVATSNGRTSSQNSKGKRASTSSIPPNRDTQQVAMILIAYFHRLTSLIMETLAEIVASADDDMDDGESAATIVIESEDVRRMGLDVWSQTDKHFLKELVQLFFERDAEVRGINVECCGLKIC